MTFDSVFIPGHLADLARSRTEPWAVASRQRIVDDAAYWADLSDTDLWELVFTPRLPRAWQVWSNGHCPTCERDLPEYDWVIDGKKLPWKVRCPHCDSIFPTNDFEAYYRSGLDPHGQFVIRGPDVDRVTANPEPAPVKINITPFIVDLHQFFYGILP